MKDSILKPGAFKKTSRQKFFLGYNISAWAKKKGLQVIKEYKFDPARKWKSDWAILGIKTLIEYEGVMSFKSRHTTITGFNGDCEKYNAAQVQGFKVLRYTVLNYMNVVSDLEKIFG